MDLYLTSFSVICFSEDLDICDGLEHCKLSSDTYQTCIWKDEEELKKVNVSRFFPTTTPPRPPMPSSSGMYYNGK